MIEKYNNAKRLKKKKKLNSVFLTSIAIASYQLINVLVQ